jgi:predicted P-loop ATPase
MEFLTDVTGTVRWLCFELIDINKKYSKEVSVTQLWAQAYALYQKGEEYNITAAEIEENENVNIHHQVSTMESELILKYLQPGKLDEHNRPVEGSGTEFMTASDISIHFAKVDGNSVRLTNVGIGRAMSFVGYERSDKRNEHSKVPQKGYYVICNCYNCVEKRKQAAQLADSLSLS